MNLLTGSRHPRVSKANLLLEGGEVDGHTRLTNVLLSSATSHRDSRGLEEMASQPLAVEMFPILWGVIAQVPLWK